MSIIKLTDTIKTSESLNNRKIRSKNVGYRLGGEKHQGMRAEIEITNELGEVLFTENSSVIGGATMILEKLFNIKSTLNVSTINDILGINAPAAEGQVAKPTTVCLFGVGTGGAPDTMVGKTFDVDFKARAIPKVIPFRYTDQPLTTVQKSKYFGAKTVDNKVAYYFKKFETEPVIRQQWLDSDDPDIDGSPVESNVHESSRTEEIEVFSEIILKIDNLDCREYFSETGEIDKSRMNAIGLYDAEPYITTTGATEYRNVRLFALLYINNELLSSQKELNFRYRLYSA